MIRFTLAIEFVDSERSVVGEVSATVLTEHLPRLGESVGGYEGLPGVRATAFEWSDLNPVAWEVTDNLLLSSGSDPAFGRVVEVMHFASVPEAAPFFPLDPRVTIRLPDPGLASRRVMRDNEPSAWSTSHAVADEPREDDVDYYSE